MKFLISIIGIFFPLSICFASSVEITTAQGGDAIPASSAGGSYTLLSPIVIKEFEPGQIGPSGSDLIITLPEGFEFDTDKKITAVAFTDRIQSPELQCLGGSNRTLRLGTSSNGATTTSITPSPSFFSVHIKQMTAGDCKAKLTLSGLRVRPINTQNHTGLITYSGTAEISGIEKGETSLGELKIFDDIEEDMISPVITLLGPSEMTSEVNTSFVDPGVRVEDNVDQDLTPDIYGIIEEHTLGKYELTYSVRDKSGNISEEVKRTVRIVDTTAPIISLIGGDELFLEIYSVFQDPGVEASDNYDESVSVEIMGEVDTNTLGVYEIKYYSEDSSGNNREVIRKVHIVEKIPEPPVIEEKAPETLPIKRRSSSGSKVSNKVRTLEASSMSGIPQTPFVLGASTESCESIDEDELLNQNPIEVKKLQKFLNKDLVLMIPETGYINELTTEALEIFKEKYRSLETISNPIFFINSLICIN